MQFKEAEIKEFMTIYEEEFEEKLTTAEATGIMRRMVNLYLILLRPLPSEEKKKTTSLS